MPRPKFPTGTTLPVSAIYAIRDAQAAYDRDPEGYERREQERKREWSLEECIARGCLPTGEPIEYRFGEGPWSQYPEEYDEHEEQPE